MHGYAGEIGHTIVTTGGRTDTFEMLVGFPNFESVSPAAEARVVEQMERILIYGFARPPIRLAAVGSDGVAIGAAPLLQDTLFDLPPLENGSDSNSYIVGSAS